MYNNQTHNAHRHQTGDAHLYDNGCVLCDCQEMIRQYVSGDYNLPCWLTAEEGEKSAQQDVLTQIRTIKAFHGLMTAGQYRVAMYESYGK